MTQEVPNRPTEAEIQEKISDLKERKQMGLNSAVESIKMEFESMAAGEDAEGIREQYYSGWANEDFQKVLDALD